MKSLRCRFVFRSTFNPNCNDSSYISAKHNYVFQNNVAFISFGLHCIFNVGSTLPVMKRLWPSHSAASAPLPFAGLKHNPQPSPDDPVNTCDTDSLINVTRRLLLRSAEHERRKTPIQNSDEGWGKSWGHCGETQLGHNVGETQVRLHKRCFDWCTWTSLYYLN